MSTGDAMNIASYLANVIDEIGATSIDEEDRVIVRGHMLDAIASAFVGCRNKALEALVKLCPKTSEGLGWPGGGPEMVAPLDGGMVWSFAVNASVYEDGSREGACHPGAVVIPTIIALSKGRSWERIDRAVIAGYEAMVRLARGGNPEFTRRGFHPTAIVAPFGAAATASVLLEYDPPTTQNALCLAALGSSGLMSAFRSGQTQPLQVAWSVRNGISAALIAGTGHRGHGRIFEEGFYPAYLGKLPDPPIDKPLEKKTAIRGGYLKPYPGCRHIHPSIDALVEALQGSPIEPSQIRGIKVRTYRIAVETEIHPVKERGDAYFNIPYALAARIVLGSNDWDAFDERHFNNETIVEIMKKVEVKIDPEVEGLYPRQRGSIVEIDVGRKEPLYGKVTHPLGEPENPLPSSLIVEKFRRAAAPFLSEKTMERMESVLEISPLAPSADTLFEGLCGG